jgi:hypothetical protein
VYQVCRPIAHTLRLTCPQTYALLFRLLAFRLQLIILDAHGRKKAEEAEFKAALEAALAERDAEGRALITAYDKAHKHVLREGAANAVSAEEQVRGLGVSTFQGSLGVRPDLFLPAQSTAVWWLQRFVSCTH